MSDLDVKYLGRAKKAQEVAKRLCVMRLVSTDNWKVYYPEAVQHLEIVSALEHVMADDA